MKVCRGRDEVPRLRQGLQHSWTTKSVEKTEDSHFLGVSVVAWWGWGGARPETSDKGQRRREAGTGTSYIECLEEAQLWPSDLDLPPVEEADLLDRKLSSLFSSLLGHLSLLFSQIHFCSG